jgi:uncharacterized protein involved in exopolysaccharide biosynthesis
MCLDTVTLQRQNRHCSKGIKFMSVSVSANSYPSGREILNALFKNRAVVINVIFVLIAVASPATFQASASLLVLPSVYYAPRANPGIEPPTNASLNREEILPTEIEILRGPTLHADVIRKIGLSNLYPELLKHPGPLHQVMEFFKDLKRRIQVQLGITPLPAPSIDSVLKALPLFERDLKLVGLPEGSVIEVSFRSKDPSIAALTVNTLVAVYLSERQSLYADTQSKALYDQLQATNTQLNALEHQIVSFKLSHGLADFSEQRRLLLSQQDELQKDAFSADGTEAQLKSRITELKKQTYDLVDKDILHANADLAATNARQIMDQQELQGITEKLRQLTFDEAPLDALTRQQTVTGQSYTDLVKEYDEDRAIEELDKRTSGNIRLIEPAIAPIRPMTYTPIILAAGFLLSLLVGVLAAIIGELGRPGMISSETASRTLGIPVLATIPERGQFHRSTGV